MELTVEQGGHQAHTSECSDAATGLMLDSHLAPL